MTIGVIFGKDLVYDLKRDNWIAQPEFSKDVMVTRKNSELDKHFRHVYRVLMSRAHKGVYVYFMDKDTEKYFRSHLPEII